ncbi:ATPase associated with various cellular activities, AAA_5 [Thermogladius calderae 1633]|uniref:ATPase associated with various cellular activities, AAA_5 n=1 Tax=Thermogladius calderae (strain DSM 22663 / VKM B-2946 / 1633) TaxID=1184251 RepID=I3TDB5_THEC1|nr:MoxR family ATPase [Thermogladius calderae]AFK50753.1 ATPase associated with various cellular activities, AAA_5 [Thermogladius calderae 1633]
MAINGDKATDPIVSKVREIYSQTIRKYPVIRNPPDIIRYLREHFKLIVKPYIVYITVAAFLNNRPVLFEGPPGTGKTEIGEAILSLWSGKSAFILPCSENYDEYRVIGDFHPAMAMSKGFNEESFIPRPLLAAMILGTGVLIDDIRRSSEEFQNLLLDIIDKRRIIIPELKRVYYQKDDGFQIILTSNPYDIAQGELSDAFLRRVVRVEFKYPTLEEEFEVIKLRLGDLVNRLEPRLIEEALQIVRTLRQKAVYKPGISDSVMWLTLASLLAEARGLDKAGRNELADAGRAVLLKNVEDEALLNELLPTRE